jgi:hypothetical protein
MRARDRRAGAIAALTVVIGIGVAGAAWADTIHSGGTITTNTTWYASGNDHIVTGNTTVASGATLTIEDGCVVRFESARSLTVHGTLNAWGSSGTGVLFTRNDETDEWNGLLFYSGSSGNLEYCTIEHATYSNGYGIYASGDMPTLANCTVRNNDYGLYASGITNPTLSSPNTFQDNNLNAVLFTNCTLPSISNQTMTGHTGADGAIYMNNTGEFHIGTGNTITGNSWGLVMTINSYPDAASSGNIPLAGNTNDDGIKVSGGTAGAGKIWRDVGADYIVTANSTIGASGSLTIEDGVNVRFENARALTVHGTLSAPGSSGTGVLFTRRDETDEWNGLLFYSGSSGNLQYCTIERATYSNGYGIYASGDMPTLANCTVRNNDYGLYASGITNPTLSSPNTFQDNNAPAVLFTNCTLPSISNQTMTGHTGANGAIYMDDTGEFHIGTGNTITGNSWGLVMTINSFPDAASSGNIPLAGNTNTDGIKVSGGTAGAGKIWRDVGADYIVTANSTIGASGSLTIEDGVNVRFEHARALTIHGTLDALGSSGTGVLFTRRDPTDEWNGLLFYSDSSGNLQYCTIERATYSNGYGIYASGAIPTIANCTVRYNDYGLYASGITNPTLSSPNTFQDNNAPAVLFTNCTLPSISNQTMTGHTGTYGAIYMDGTGEFHIGTGNTITGNSWGLVMTINSYPDAASSGNIPLAGNTNTDGINVSGGTAGAGRIWRDVGADYIVTANSTIGASGSLTIEDGVNVRFEHARALTIHGTLDALGSSGTGVLFTRRDPTDEWNGLLFYSGSSGNLQYCTIEHATYGNGYGIYASGAMPTIANCTLRYNDYGLYATGIANPTLSSPNTFQDNNAPAVLFTNCTLPSISNQTMTGHTETYGAIFMNDTGEFHIGTGNTITGNSWGLVMTINSYPDAASSGNIPLAGNTNDDGIKVSGGTAGAGKIWRDVGADYIVTANSTIGASGSLTIEDGVNVRFEHARSLTMHGTLDALGSSGTGVLFTRRDETDEWNGLLFYSGSSGNLQYCTIEHATYSNGYGIYANGTAPELQNCTLRDNDYGVYGTNASPHFVNCQIIENGLYGIYLTDACVPTFGSSLAEWNDVHSNGPGDPDRDLVNGTENITAQYVYWGTVNETAIQERIHHRPDDAALGLVVFSPWTGADHDSAYTGTPTSLIELEPIPTAFGLSQNYPNPFPHSTEIEYALPQDTWVEIVVFNVAGRRVATPVSRFEKAGYRSVRWDAHGLGSGVYFYRIQAGDFVETKRMLLVR